MKERELAGEVSEVALPCTAHPASSRLVAVHPISSSAQSQTSWDHVSLLRSGGSWSLLPNASLAANIRWPSFYRTAGQWPATALQLASPRPKNVEESKVPAAQNSLALPTLLRTHFPVRTAFALTTACTRALEDGTVWPALTVRQCHPAVVI